MRVKLSNYISRKLVESGIIHAFSVVGGGAMHLNNALGHEPGLEVTYNHHEQASAIAAECYARIHNRPAVCCSSLARRCWVCEERELGISVHPPTVLGIGGNRTNW